jgi:thiamine-phosphate pyrophosphorylase
LLELVDELLSTSRPLGATLLVNDRLDVALATDCDGAHLGGGSLPAAAARVLLGPERWVGVSCHDAGEVDAAVRSGADFAFVGSIYPTASHPGRTGMGPTGLAEIAARTSGLPLLGIGGIGSDEVEALLDAGAHGVATIRGVWSTADPATAVTRYLEALGI